MDRETDQLLKCANFYFAMAEKILSKHGQLESQTIGQTTSRYNRSRLSLGETVLAHFASAAVRLVTICEIKKYCPTENYRTKFYEPSGARLQNLTKSKIQNAITNNLHEHIHFLLRDNVAHEEFGIKNKRIIATDRFTILKPITIGSCRKAIKKTVRTIRDSL